MKNIEGQIYNLNNQYLSKEEKQEVELWFQLPSEFTSISFYIMAILWVVYGFSWIYIVIIPLSFNIVIAIFNWFFYNKRLTYILYLTFLHSVVGYIFGFGTAIFLFINHSYVLMVISLLFPFGIPSLIEPSILLIYPILSRKYGVHPKYAFFKRIYGYTFPFEGKNG